MKMNKTIMNCSVYCNNCNSNSHSFSKCIEPIYSYGILCYKIINGKISYIFVRRKQSFAFTDFIRGRYDKNNHAYIHNLISRMTQIEHQYLKTKTFTEIWKIMWGQNYKKHIKEMELCKVIFYETRKKHLLEQLHTNYMDPEWGIPKGKQMINETITQTSQREFTEETNVNCEDIVFEDIEPMSEEYVSIDNKRYISIYFLARYIGADTPLYINPNNLNQCTEIGDIKWYSLEECILACRSYYYQKIQCLIHAHRYIKNLFPQTQSTI